VTLPIRKPTAPPPPVKPTVPPLQFDTPGRGFDREPEKEQK